MYKYIIILFSFLLCVNNKNLDNYTNGLLLANKANTIDDRIENRLDNVSLEETINPDIYIVGPGDSFLFNMISSDGMVTTDVSISPLGTVLIPNVGDIYVDKLTITETFNKIKDKCLKTYANAKINLTLFNIRKFKVQVVGPVYKPGNVIVNPLTRISDIYDLVKSEYEEKNDNISLRNIELIRGTSSINVDLLSYYQNGNKDLNPYIMQGDIVKFKIKDKFITISGGVKIPNIYEYYKDETLRDLIEIAGGFSDNADTNHIHLTRFINDKDTKEYIFDNYKLTEDFVLEANDYIHVRYKKDFKRLDLVKIDGEINFPGFYPYSSKSTINDIITLSGGYTNNADTNKIVITNNQIINNLDTEYERIMLIEDENRTASEKSYIKSRNKITRGMIVSEDIKRTDNILDYSIEDGDFIYIPKLTNYVEIIGSVKFPGRYPFDQNKTIADYIKEAGGKTKNSTRNMYVIDNASNQRVKVGKRNNLNNGDVLFVQSKDDFSPYNRFKEAMQILAQAATILAVININE